MILHNGRILTLHPVLRESAALAIAGRVLGGVDSREDAIASHAHERIDLKGKFVAPGFVDSHMHFMAWATSGARLDLSGARSPGDLENAVRTHAVGLPDVGDLSDQWVIGAGWPTESVPRGVSLADSLDEAAGGRPVALISADGHALILSRSAQTLLETAPPAGGTYTEREAFDLRGRIPDPELGIEAVYRAARTAAKLGITSVHDMDGSRSFRWFQRLDDERGLPIRVWQHFPVSELAALETLGFRSGFGRDRLRIGGIKIFVDGTLGSGTAALHDPETGVRPGATEPTSGSLLLSADEIAEIAERAGALGLPVLAHAIGDAAVTTVVDALERTASAWQQADGKGPRPRIEHAQLVTDRDLERCAELGIVLSVQPTHVESDRALAERYWNDDRLRRAYRYRDAVDAGALVISNSDAPIAPADPLAMIRAARCGGSSASPWKPEQGLDADDALASCTIGPAIAAGCGDKLGRLMPGYDADLVVLSDDPRESDDVEVLATMVAGRWTHGRGSL